VVFSDSGEIISPNHSVGNAEWPRHVLVVPNFLAKKKATLLVQRGSLK
jgi:hypothetical protein